jgi:hypothetical protein
MRQRRPYFAWFLLIATLAIALPRTWVHDCAHDLSAHQTHGNGSPDDRLDHARCPICDYAPTAPFQAATLLLLTEAAHQPIHSLPCIQAHSATQIRLSALRGPPTA